MRNIKDTDLVGKTIKSIDNHSDGTNLELWAEDAVETQYGNIPGIFVQE